MNNTRKARKALALATPVATPEVDVVVTPVAPVAVAPAPVVTPKPSRATLDAATTINLLVPVNPKKVGSAAYARYALYVNGATVASALAAGLWRVDLIWDLKHGFISLSPATAPAPVTPSA